MKTNIIVAIVVMIAMTGLAVADKQPGAVMASDVDGDDTNLYPGTAIYIKGVNLAPDTPFSWEIYDMAAGCSNPIPGIGCGTLVNSGTGGSTNSDGDISPPYPTGWSIPTPDYNGHDYKLVTTIDPEDPEYADIYTKVDTLVPVPELTTIGLVSVGIVGLFLVSRKYRKG
jgi:hypothetical protein